MLESDIVSALVFTGLMMQIFIQFYCVYFALKARKISNNARCFWYYAGAAFTIMGLRRITSLLAFFGFNIIPKHHIINYFDKLLLPLTISILLFIGLRKIFIYVREETKYIGVLEGRLEDNIDKLKKLRDELKEKDSK